MKTMIIEHKKSGAQSSAFFMSVGFIVGLTKLGPCCGLLTAMNR